MCLSGAKEAAELITKKVSQMTPQMKGPLEWISQNHPIKLLEPLKSVLFRPSNYSMMSQYKSDWCVCVCVGDHGPQRIIRVAELSAPASSTNISFL